MSSRRATCSQCVHQTTQPAVSAELTTTNALKINVPLPYEHITAQEIKATATHDMTAIPDNAISRRRTKRMLHPVIFLGRDSGQL